MFFEGSEKKAEIIVDAKQLSLLTDINDDFWVALVGCSQAKILSSISNAKCKAFILSESSLFVWHDRVQILTCGETQLVKAVEYFIVQLGKGVIKQLTYQRKNEYFAKAQPSDFAEDVNVIERYLSGKVHLFGDAQKHHNYVFQLDNTYKVEPNDVSYELLAYQISEQASQHLTQPKLTASDIRQFLCINDILPGFIIDDFVFSPYGYSLNAIKGLHYLTIHVTPQMASSYISFEANIDLMALAPKLLTILKPKSFDFMSFNEQSFAEKLNRYIPPAYQSLSPESKQLDNGYLISFAHYALAQKVNSQVPENDVKLQSEYL